VEWRYRDLVQARLGAKGGLWFYEHCLGLMLRLNGVHAELGTRSGDWLAALSDRRTSLASKTIVSSRY
jgi:hypothetical protein